MKSVWIIILFSLFGLNRVRCYYENEFGNTSSIRQVFDNKVYGISMAIGVGIFRGCYELDLPEILLNDVKEKITQFTSCFITATNKTIESYEPVTVHMDLQTIEHSNVYPLFMCEFYRHTHACAEDMTPSLKHCIKPGNYTNLYSLFYQAAKYGIDLACDNNAEVLSFFVKTITFGCQSYLRVAVGVYIDKIAELNEDVLFSTRASCTHLVQICNVLQSLPLTECSSEIAEKSYELAIKFLERSGCNSTLDANKILISDV